MINELKILKEIRDRFNTDFMRVAEEIGHASGENPNFNIDEFSDLSPADQLAKSDEFGLINIINTSYQTQDTLERAMIQTISLAVQVVIIDRGDIAKQISIARMALVEIVQKSDFDFMRYAGLDLSSTEPTQLEFQGPGDNNCYFLVGIVLQLKIGI